MIQNNRFNPVSQLDPNTVEALTQSLSSVLARVHACTPKGEGPFRDRLWRLAEHSRASVERLFRALNESPRREQALLPVHAARELDAKSFIKLANRPGRTIREKLGHRPYLQAVRRFQSVDLPENRLLKAYVSLLAELLELRRERVHERADELLPKIQSWLRSDEALAIGRWENLPPNNVLLSHRDYRRIWDAWRWLQSIDDDTSRDVAQLETRSQTVQFWDRCARVWANGDHRFAETPVLFDGSASLRGSHHQPSRRRGRRSTAPLPHSESASRFAWTFRSCVPASPPRQSP
jgi:hypothetical protein